MPFPSRIAASSSSRPCRASQAGPCFRTDADGRIALTHDWARIFSEARRFKALALQIRHTCVRLIHLGRMPELTWSGGVAFASQANGCLRLNSAMWIRATGRLATCACCGTPGRVELLNGCGVDFLQLCALPDCEADRWAGYLLDVSPRQSASAPGKTVPPAAWPALPEGSISLCHDDTDEILAAFLATLAGAGLSFVARLQTPEVVHVRELNPQRVFLQRDVLTLQAGPATLQLGLAAVRSLALHFSATHGPQLHLLGATGALWLTLAAPAGVSGATHWLAALRAAFPRHL